MNADRPRRSKFVADGHERLRDTPEYVRAAEQARSRIRAQFAPRIAAAAPLERLWLLVLRERVIRKAIAELAPPEALYGRADTRR